MRRLALLAILAAFAAHGAGVGTAKFGDLGMDDNVVTNADISGLLSFEEDPTVPSWAKNPTPPEEAGFNAFTNNGGRLLGPLRISQDEDFDYVDTVISSNGISAWRWLPGPGGSGGSYINYRYNWWDLLTSESDPHTPAWARSETKPTYSWSEITNKPTHLSGDVPTTRKVNGKALSADVTLSASDVGAPSVAMHNVVSNLAATADGKATTAIAYLQGDDAKVVVTNYDSAVTMPSMSLQQRIDEGGSNYWKVVWNELTRWDWFLPIIGQQTNALWAAIEEKADRAWGYYDSHTGGWAPDGYLSISAPKILIAKNMAYQRHLSTDGAIWILESNGLVTEIGGVQSNGFFRISDDDGNALFEIVKGNKRTIGSSATGITTTNIMGITHCYIPYPVEAAEHPIIYATTSLGTPFISQESSSSPVNVTWTGTTGDYHAEVWPKTASASLFIKAEHETGGETYIKNTAPISAEGGILCTDGIHKVRPVYNGGTITWEVVP